MKFFSLDLETTGLIPGFHSITEFGAVYADLEGKQPLQTFYRWMAPTDFVWSTYCLDLHKNWLSNVSARLKGNQIDGDPKICLNEQQLINDFLKWVNVDLGLPILKADAPQQRVKYTAAGKNFGSFDLQFLKAIKFPDMWRHRALDPTVLYVKASDEFLPELKECKKRAINDGCTAFRTEEVAHSGVEDALDVVHLLQYGLRGLS